MRPRTSTHGGTMKLSMKLLILLAVFAMIVAACSSDSDDTTTTAAAGGDETTTTAAAGGDETTTTAAEGGASEDSSSASRGTTTTKSAGPSRTSRRSRQRCELQALSTSSTDAGSSAEQQLADVEQLISQGADALIILAQDGTAILPAVQSALDQGIPVIAYDRLIEDPRALYITFDNVEVGVCRRGRSSTWSRRQLRVHQGQPADANADFLRGGQQEILQAAIDCRRHRQRR